MNICASMEQFTLVSMRLCLDYTYSGYEWMVSRMSQIWLPWLSAMCFMQIDHVTEHWRRSKNSNFKFVKLYCRQWLTSQCHDMHDSWVHEYMCFHATIHTSAYEVYVDYYRVTVYFIGTFKYTFQNKLNVVQFISVLRAAQPVPLTGRYFLWCREHI